MLASGLGLHSPYSPGDINPLWESNSGIKGSLQAQKTLVLRQYISPGISQN